MKFRLIYPRWQKLARQTEFHLPPHGPVVFAAALQDMRAAQAARLGHLDRSRLLRSLGYDVTPSQGNYVFAAPPDRDGKRVYQGLYERKILVRHFSDPLLCHGLRISIGTRQEMEKTLAAIKEIGLSGGIQ